MLDYLEQIWPQPDQGIWEIRGEPRHFVHSKVMAWVAFDRAVRTVEEQGLDGAVDKWRGVRDAIHAQVCEHGYDEKLGSFVQSYGSKELDASLLMLPLVGFLPASDPRIRGTIEAVETELVEDGFVLRYRTHPTASTGSLRAKASFSRARSGSSTATSCSAATTKRARSSIGSSASRTTSACSPRSTTRLAKRLLGNFPQAFTHLALVNSAFNVLAAPAVADAPAARNALLAVAEVVRGSAASRARRRRR